MNSIRLRLLAWLLGPILLFSFASAALTYVLAWTPAQLAFDQSLNDLAASLAVRVAGGQGVPLLPLARADDDPDASFVNVRDSAGRLVAGDPDLPVFAGGIARDGMLRGQPVRLAARPLVLSGRALTVTVARTVRQRQQVRTAIVRALVLLQMLFTLVLAGLAWFSISNGLAPLARLRNALDRRERAELTPLEAAALPRELAPVADAFNGLLERLDAAARRQDAFLADVAHQLRTPLAGLQLQLEWLGQRHRADPDTVHATGLMAQASERMVRQTNQLLALARAEPGRPLAARFAALDLAALVAEAVQTFVSQASAKRIDLGFELGPAPLLGDRFLLRDLIDNLVDNAVRYTAPGGRVTVRTGLHGGAALLEVEDDGPGIAPERRQAVFERHVRLDQQTSGSGLGLAIVRDIAQVHGATASVGSRAGGRGALFTVQFKKITRNQAKPN